MYIKSIVIEGFKSYGSKQEIRDFDPDFNAITGMNGSGKSNIFDSICFVLGIQNLTNVRATNLTELVYKNGQAGINKATVTITFDNSNPKSGPLGYENQREVSVTRTVITGGKSKYFINGVSANNNRVHDLFQSVHLNVNNPHFLIMQGRISKVMAMKPMEILSLIEEAAGTRMYVEKKENAVKNLVKKDSRLREINIMLDEHICPLLDKLKEERKEYTKFTRVVREFEHLSKIYVAWDYSKTEDLVRKSEEENEKLKQNFENLKASIEDMKNKLTNSDARIGEIQKQMDLECGNKLQELEAELRKKELTESKAASSVRDLKEALNNEMKKQADVKKNLKDEKAIVAQKEKELINCQKKLEALKAQKEKDKAAMDDAQANLTALNAGVADSSGENASLAAQLIDANQDVKAAETEAKSLHMAIEDMKKKLQKKEAENKKLDKNDSKELQAMYQTLASEIEKFKAEISQLNYEDGHLERLVDECKKATKECERLQAAIYAIYVKFPQLSFDYVDPVKGFDRSKVKGPVCLLMELKDGNEALALDVAASGKLHNVIVSDEETAKLILGKGQLKRRCTVIPLNKIQGQVIDNRTEQAAVALVGKENVSLALSRIHFDRELTPAMEYVYGNVFICTVMDAAMKVTVAKNIKKRCVTLEGEVFDPAGTLSGGSMKHKGRFLTELAPLPKLKKALTEKQEQLNQIENDIKKAETLQKRYNHLVQQCELKETKAEVIKGKIQQTRYNTHMKDYEEMKQLLEDYKARLSACTENRKKAENLIKELELKTVKSTRESKVQQKEKLLEDCTLKAAASEEKYKSYAADVNFLMLDIQGIIDTFPTYEEQIVASSKVIEGWEKKFQEAEEKRKEIKEAIANLSEDIKKQRGIFNSHSDEISKIAEEKKETTKNIESSNLKVTQMEFDIKHSGVAAVEAKTKLKHLVGKYKWIEGQKKYFGVQNSEFDFENFDPKVSGPRLKELEELKEKLQKNVNMRAQNMLSSVEEQFENLIQKKNVVMNDKEVIENVIRELDEQKKVALVNACEQVNKDFGSIFRTLLPGTDAKLVSQPEKTVLDGLEFKVAFGNVWKESLSELSGGQKSLVALSLILALLLFNPAPIYILDEVDAALDLSHTQNIGKMMKLHFKQSQFIVVSLKEAMYSNANVLYTTQFIDGMSSVTRTVQRH